MADEEVQESTNIQPCFDCHAHIYSDEFSQVSVFEVNNIDSTVN